MFPEGVSPRNLEIQPSVEGGAFSAYKELLELIAFHKVEIIHILSTPRSSSTALERALYQSDDVQLQINDAWANYDLDDREQKTYEQLLAEIKNQLRSREKIKVIIKSVADYIPPGEAFERMCQLSSHTVVLTRNPLLQMESMMKIMAESIDPEDVFEAGLSVDQHAKSLGYESWPDMRTKVNQSKSYFEYQQIYTAFFPNEQAIHASAVMRLPILHNLPDSVLKRAGYDTKDEYATAHGFINWHAFLDSIDVNPDTLNDHTELLKAIFLCRITGWDAMLQHVTHLENSTHRFTVIDSTIFRAKPENYLAQVAEKVGVKYGESVVDWQRDQKQFNPGDDEGVSYYDKVIQSTGIHPPTESPLTLEHFPQFIREHLSETAGAFWTYLKLLKLHANDFGHTLTLDLLQASVKDRLLQDIDPVFAYVLWTVVDSQPDADFIEKHYHYSEEFRLIDQLKKQSVI